MAAIGKNVRAAYARMFLAEDGRLHEDAKAVMAELKRFSGKNKSSLIISPIQRVTDVPGTMYRLGAVDVYEHIKAILEDDIGVIDDGRRQYAESE